MRGGNAAGFVYAIHELIHRRESNPLRDSVSQNVNVPALDGKLETGNHEESAVGEGFAKAHIIVHASFVEDFSVIADHNEVHAGQPEDSYYFFEWRLSVRKRAVNVQYTFHLLG